MSIILSTFLSFSIALLMLLTFFLSFEFSISEYLSFCSPFFLYSRRILADIEQNIEFRKDFTRVNYVVSSFLSFSIALSMLLTFFLSFEFSISEYLSFCSLFTPNIGRYRAKYRVSQGFHACQFCCLIVSFIFDRFINASYILSFAEHVSFENSPYSRRILADKPRK